MYNGFSKDHNSSFIELSEGEVNVETDEWFYGDILPLLKGERDSVLHSILEYR